MARKHDWFDNAGDIEWNIFNNNVDNMSLTLSPNVNGKKEGDIWVIIKVEKSTSAENAFDLLWEPGYACSMGCMEGFDNVIKWKADYTLKWLDESFISKAHDFFVENQTLRSWMKRMLRNCH